MLVATLPTLLAFAPAPRVATPTPALGGAPRRAGRPGSRRDGLALGAAAAFSTLCEPLPAFADDVKTVVVAGATGQTGAAACSGWRRCGRFRRRRRARPDEGGQAGGVED